MQSQRNRLHKKLQCIMYMFASKFKADDSKTIKNYNTEPFGYKIEFDYAQFVHSLFSVSSEIDWPVAAGFVHCISMRTI